MSENDLFQHFGSDECATLERLIRRVAYDAFQKGEFYAIDAKRQNSVIDELQKFIKDGLNEVFRLKVVNGISRLKILFSAAT